MLPPNGELPRVPKRNCPVKGVWRIQNSLIGATHAATVPGTQIPLLPVLDPQSMNQPETAVAEVYCPGRVDSNPSFTQGVALITDDEPSCLAFCAEQKKEIKRSR